MHTDGNTITRVVYQAETIYFSSIIMPTPAWRLQWQVDNYY